MNRAYWDAQAARWDAEIFDSLAEDRTGVIRRALRRAARAHDAVLDFGCGVGGYLPFLARSFARVHGVDWSARCVAAARRRAAALPNVTVERSTPRALARLAGGFGCVVAANVVIHPAQRVRERLWGGLRRAVRRGGTAIVVVPSLESAAFCESVRRRTAPRRASSYDFHPGMRRLEAGVVAIEGVPTKHYVHDELSAALTLAGFRPFRVSRVRYSWTTENLTPPRRLHAGLPWDWLAEARAV
ncbi:MAG: class I SAM-dependent methyltransferase [Gemmatimonadota bacterium]|nr:class I SAM-dependent methyltransferase [Gemmatimonadota bacterium]MDE3127497.1 class I SAM-dependent methyltransferase [Gemmatimonadota bacterium]MDE3173884.1 class I SAM-dependent methyltransferase [Gemmatimonadota bacterium]